jgi:hypothetical protein
MRTYRRKPVIVPPGWLTAADAVLHADVSGHYLLKLRQDGGVKSQRLGKNVYVCKDDIDRWMNSVSTPAETAARPQVNPPLPRFNGPRCPASASR